MHINFSWIWGKLWEIQKQILKEPQYIQSQALQDGKCKQGLLEEELGSPGSLTEVHSSRMSWIITVSQQHKLVRHDFLMTSLFFLSYYSNKNFIFLIEV